MLITQILKEKEGFSLVEMTLADYFLNEQTRLNEQSARSIAKILFISPSTIVRFTQKIGFQGYNEFKDAYLKEIDYLSQNFKEIDPNFPFEAQDKNIVIANKLRVLYHEVIDDVLSLMSHDKLQNALSLIKKAETIYVFSLGVQLDVAQVFKDKMLKIGKNVIIEEKANEIFYRSQFCDEKSIFILISYSGETETLMRIVKQLHIRNISMLAITTYGENTLSQFASSVLYVSSREKLIENLGSFSMNISVLFILDILYANIFNEHYDTHYKNRVHASKSFEQYRTTYNPLLKDSEE